MPSKIVPVIMSGGSGTRLWPLSRTRSPKQLHALVTERTMIGETAARVTGQADGVEFSAPVVVLNALQLEGARDALTEAAPQPSHYIIEPIGRNTAPVAAIAAEVVAEAEGPDALILLLPADHHIADVDGFRRAISAGAELAKAGHMVTFGIQPDRAETGYGYIRRGAETGPGFAVDAFTEKPNAQKAEAFLESGEYFWNAGIFLFRAATLTDEITRHASDVQAASSAALSAARIDGDEIHLDREAFARCPGISIDYAVMERTDQAAVIPADIGWSDVGAWHALWSLAETDSAENAVRGDVHLDSSSRTYAVSTGPAVLASGVEDLVIVATPDAVMVAPRSDSDAVKRLVAHLKETGRDELL